jgi:hypothetical protein
MTQPTQIEQQEQMPKQPPLRDGYMMTADDVALRYAGILPNEPARPEIKAYACAYGLGCEGPNCPHEDCPRKK